MVNVSFLFFIKRKTIFISILYLIKFLLCCTEHLRVWNIDIATNKLHVLNASLGKIRRNFTAMKISADDSILFVGTMSGDVVKLRLNCRLNEFNKATLIGCFGRHNPKKSPGKDCEKFMNGVRDLLICPNNERQLLIGAGNGTIELVEERNIHIKDYPSPTWPMFKAVNKENTSNFLQTHSNFFLLRCIFCYLKWINSFSVETKKSQRMYNVTSNEQQQPNYLYCNRFVWNLYTWITNIHFKTSNYMQHPHS